MSFVLTRSNKHLSLGLDHGPHQGVTVRCSMKSSFDPWARKNSPSDFEHAGAAGSPQEVAEKGAFKITKRVSHEPACTERKIKIPSNHGKPGQEQNTLWQADS